MFKLVFAFFVMIIAVSCKQNMRPVLAPEYLHHENALQVITSVINNRDSTISIIYGNDRAIDFARNKQSLHRAGEKYVMVTSAQKPMPHWYGTNMNGVVLTVEYVTTISDKGGSVVLDYKIQHNNPGAVVGESFGNISRVEFITSQQAAVIP
ncbi:MAG: hypothetical protein J7527_05535 [Chitinophagaceae bacterium]|nr:hypothetical protein [Chitinophagaceae bacterium]